MLNDKATVETLQAPGFRRRFLARVKRRGECLIWTGAVNQDGYGMCTLPARPHRVSRAHRIAWVIEHGPIPDGLCVLHSCDVPGCIALPHLRLGTNSDNVRDKVARGRARGGPAGSRSRFAKLKAKDVHRILSRCAAGLTRTDVAREYGVSVALVSAIVLRRVWKHLRV